MLEVIGFIAIGYLIFKFAPIIIEAGFKFAVICLGFIAFLFICAWIWGSILVMIN